MRELNRAERLAHTMRQKEIIPDEVLSKPVTIIGVGAIGSFTALSLAKMGMDRITVYDFDEVSDVNMSNQFFRYKDIGTNKAEALRQLVLDFTGINITAHPRRVEKQDFAAMQGLLIVAVDSMDTRASVLEHIRTAWGHRIELVIDPRMGAEEYMMYTYKPPEFVAYTKTLYPDSEVEAPRCTAKSTIYTATLAAGLIVKNVKAYLTGSKVAKTTVWPITQCGTSDLKQWEL